MSGCAFFKHGLIANQALHNWLDVPVLRDLRHESVISVSIKRRNAVATHTARPKLVRKTPA
jgi:hypothetical protein